MNTYSDYGCVQHITLPVTLLCSLLRIHDSRVSSKMICLGDRVPRHIDTNDKAGPRCGRTQAVIRCAAVQWRTVPGAGHVCHISPRAPRDTCRVAVQVAARAGGPRAVPARVETA